jgi:hypothetical protein
VLNLKNNENTSSVFVGLGIGDIPERKAGGTADLSTNKSSSAMATTRSVGIDIGSQKTIIVSDDGERILTSTGSMTRPTLVLFSKELWYNLMSANHVVDR